ncbi:hypothetical protein NW939_08775 [Aeromonas caviae]|uniref:hypothetical protein n=1 Tax=Aeromonas caviae TaxID=648 RepID=UPI0021C85FA0|nr:hypothetical protein [Aeromonas caviae]MCR9024710.1 hypothetical protein [Aeromonas caviae]
MAAARKQRIQELKLTEKLKKTGIRSKISYLIALMAIFYFSMTLLKGGYLATSDSQFRPVQTIHMLIESVIQKTWIYPLSEVWKLIPYFDFEDRELLNTFRVVTPPTIVLLICSLFIAEHRTLKIKYYNLRSEIEKEIALREMRKDAGLEITENKTSVDIMINNAINNDPSWSEKWWGQVIIGVIIAIVVALIGLN